MSMHATLGVRYSDGSIDGCYVHLDGLTMRYRISEYLSKKTTTDLAILINRAQVRGGMRAFHSAPYDFPLDEPPVTMFLDDDDPYIINEKNWEDDHMGAHQSYLVDYESGTILGRPPAG